MFDKKKKKNVIESTPVVNKQYSYSLNGITLSFTLRTDIDTELKDFLELMKRASSDIAVDLLVVNAEKK